MILQIQVYESPMQSVSFKYQHFYNIIYCKST